MFVNEGATELHGAGAQLQNMNNCTHGYGHWGTKQQTHFVCRSLGSSGSLAPQTRPCVHDDWCREPRLNPIWSRLLRPPFGLSVVSSGVHFSWCAAILCRVMCF